MRAVRELRIRTERRTQLVEITGDVQAALDGEDGASAALVFVPHTTAGVTINEHADPAVARDFEAALERIVGDGWGWQVLVPLRQGRLALGTWQGIFFCEFDGPRERTVQVAALR
jgi:thiamine phosphate synthase YjbQ (UPF0047 family)